jgi:hypothetical protein
MGTVVEMCTPCGIRHPHTNWKAQVSKDLELIYTCGDYYKNPVSAERKMDGLSPQQVLSGVQYGMPEQHVFSDAANKETHTQAHKRSVDRLRKAVK